MPKELTHWILAEQAMKGLDSSSRLQGIIRSHRDSYLGGAALPDTLLHLFRGPSARTALLMAHSFHDAHGNSYDPLIRTESNYGGALPHDLLACLLGVLSHMQVDIVFHPYVYAMCGSNDIGRHYQLETDIDVHFLRSGVFPPIRHLKEVVTPETRPLLVRAASILFDPGNELPLQALEQALTLHCRFQAMYGKTGWKITAAILGRLLGPPFREQRFLFYPLNSLSAAYLDSNGNGRAWSHPVSGALNEASIEDLAQEAIQRTVALFERIEERGSLTAALGDLGGPNLLTGLHGVGKSEMDRVSATS